MRLLLQSTAEAYFLRVVRCQIFIDTFAVNQLTVLIVAQLNQPIEHIGWPFAVGKESWGSAPKARSNREITSDASRSKCSRRAVGF